MIRCYLTGMEFSLEEGFVLNKRAVFAEIQNQKARIASLLHLMEQLGPVDDVRSTPKGSDKAVTKKHRRLISRAVAEAISAGHPNVDLFLSWPEYKIQPETAKLFDLSGDPNYGNAISLLNAVKFIGRHRSLRLCSAAWIINTNSLKTSGPQFAPEFVFDTTTAP